MLPYKSLGCFIVYRSEECEWSSDILGFLFPLYLHQCIRLAISALLVLFLFKNAFYLRKLNWWK
jgi:phosphoglycerol transferase MdoB-like AlkP superfamily enzyme